MSTFKKTKVINRFITSDENVKEIINIPRTNILLCVFPIDIGQIGETHTHDEVHLIFVRSGKVNYTVNADTRMLGPGDFIAILPNTPHSFEEITDEPLCLVELALYSS